MSDPDGLDVDDQWLYGDAPDIPGIPGIDPPTNPTETAESAEASDTPPLQEPIDDAPKDASPSMETNGETELKEEPPEEEKEPVEDGEIEKVNGEGSDKDETDDDSDDDINVVIGDIKATTPASYTSLNIKRGGLLTTSTADKNKAQPGKFAVEEFDQMGTINGVPAAEYNLDSLEDKPWRKPGADITDYFNYGFNEDTWKAYCERQKRLRVNESGVGLMPLNSIGMPRTTLPTSVLNDNSKYGGSFTGVRKAGPPPGRRMMGPIDVIGNPNMNKPDAPKENVIQVMTADRREYSRKPPGFPDMSMPPPASFEEFTPEFGFNPEPEPFYGGYEPTQDVQWGTEPNPANWPAPPPDVKQLTGLPPPIIPAAVPQVVTVVLPPPLPVVAVPPITTSRVSVHRDVTATPPPVMGALDGVDGSLTPPPSSVLERERDRERDRGGRSTPSQPPVESGRETSRARSEKPRERGDRERSHRRERSRSRSRRHKSRSRSPSHRSHRKKKSRRHNDDSE